MWRQISFYFLFYLMEQLKEPFHIVNNFLYCTAFWTTYFLIFNIQALLYICSLFWNWLFFIVENNSLSRKNSGNLRNQR